MTGNRVAARKTENGHRTLIAAHRGGAGLWPENSLEAFGNTTGLSGIDFVEFDVHPSRDGHLVVHHDPTLERMTNGSGRISEKTYAELSALSIKGTDNGRIPLLSEVLEVFAQTAIDLRIEIKAGVDLVPYPGLEKRLAGEIRARRLEQRIVVTSFNVATLTRFREAAQVRGMIWLVKKAVFLQIGGIDSVLTVARDHGIDEVALHQSDFGATEMAAASDAGIRLGAFAVNDEAAMRKVLGLGASAFTTNYPDLALNIRDRMAA